MLWHGSICAGGTTSHHSLGHTPSGPLVTLARACWAGQPRGLCLLQLIAKLCARTGCPHRPGHSCTPSGPSVGRCLCLSPKAQAFKLFGSIIQSLWGIIVAVQPAILQKILPTIIFVSFFFVCVLFHFETWSHS